MVCYSLFCFRFSITLWLAFPSQIVLCLPQQLCAVETFFSFSFLHLSHSPPPPIPPFLFPFCFCNGISSKCVSGFVFDCSFLILSFFLSYVFAVLSIMFVKCLKNREQKIYFKTNTEVCLRPKGKIYTHYFDYSATIVHFHAIGH